MILFVCVFDGYAVYLILDTNHGLPQNIYCGIENHGEGGANEQWVRIIIEN